jgi:hypothetical protein
MAIVNLNIGDLNLEVSSLKNIYISHIQERIGNIAGGII